MVAAECISGDSIAADKGIVVSEGGLNFVVLREGEIAE